MYASMTPGWMYDFLQIACVLPSWPATISTEALIRRFASVGDCDRSPR